MGKCIYFFKKNASKLIFYTLIIALFCAWIYINYSSSKDDFFDANLYEILTILLILIISYLFVKSHDDEVKRKDIFYELILKMEDSLGGVTNSLTENPINRTGITQELKKMKNIVLLMENALSHFEVKEQVRYVKSNLYILEEKIDFLLDGMEQDKLVLEDKDRKIIQIYIDNILFKSQQMLSIIFF